MNDQAQPQAASARVGRLFVIMLAAITLVGPLSLHLFFPAIPDIKASFGISDATAELTLSMPLFAMALFTLVYGGASDRYGRRPVLLGGIGLFLVGAWVAGAAPTIWLLILGRLMQAAGGACGLALSRAIARDVFGTDRLVKVIAYLTMAYTLGPMAAPAIAGFLVDVSGWRSVLVFAGVVGSVLAILTYLVIHETNPDRGGPRPRGGALAAYRELFGDARFMGVVLQSGFSSGGFFAMASAAAFIATEYLHRPAGEYGLYFLFFPAGYILGNFTSSRLSGRVAIETMVLAGATLLIVTAAVQMLIVLAGFVTMLTTFIPGFFVTYAQGIALPNAQAGAISVSRRLAGTAAGIGVFMQMFAAASFTQLYGLLADGTPFPMALTVSISAVLSVSAGIVPFALARRRRRA